MGRFLAAMLVSALLSLVLYIAVHEFGHVIVLWSVGADITEFSVLNAHVLYTGGQWTDLSDRWMWLSGTLLPVVAAMAAMLFYRKDVENAWYRSLYFFAFLPAVFSLAAWAAGPFLFMAGQASPNDDIYKFLYNFTQDHPAWLVSLAAALLMAICIWLAARKGLIRNFCGMIRRVREERRGEN